MLRLQLNRGLLRLLNRPLRLEPTQESSTELAGTEAAFIVAGAFACAAAGVITLVVSLFERAGVFAGPVIANVTLGAIIGLLALGVLDHKWQGKTQPASKIYSVSASMLLIGLLLGAMAFALLMPA